MHYPVGKSRSQNSTILNTSTAAPSHCRSVWRHQIHRNSWLCSLIPPKFFFVSLYLLTITFWSITGMICGGKVSGSCPLGILQAFSIFNENGRVQLRKAMSSNKWHNYDPPSLIILLFAWYSITASAAGLFAFRRAHQFVRHGRYINGRAVLRVNPMYLLAPSIFGYVFTFLLLFCWTFFVVEDQLPDISHQSPNAKSILSFIFMTILPLMTIWSGFFYIIYGLVRSILFMNALLKGWSIPPPLPQRVTSFNSSGNFNGLDNHKNPQSSGSIRRYYRELAQTVSARKNDTAASTEPLNPLETTSGSVRSQKLEPIMEVPEQ